MSRSGTGCPGRRDVWTPLGLVTLDIPEGGPLSKGSALRALSLGVRGRGGRVVSSQMHPFRKR